MSSKKDLRRSPRYDYECTVLIEVGDQHYFSTMENISAAGCCIHRPEGWNQNRGVKARLFLTLGRRLTPGVVATTVWGNDSYVGFEYASPMPLPRELVSITVGHDHEPVDEHEND